MTVTETEAAAATWVEAETAEQDKLSAAVEDVTGLLAIRQYVLSHLKLKPVDIHDACVALGELPPSGVSVLSHLDSLQAVMSDASIAFQPQIAKTHTKPALKETIRCLKRGGAKLSLRSYTAS